MTRVIARCPNCGVEHDDAAASGGPCEVCGTTLRNWCRLHSREIGWLDSPECPRCAAEAAAVRARPAPPRAPAPVPAPAPRPPVRPAPPARHAPRAPAEPPRAPVRGPPRRPRIVVAEAEPAGWDAAPDPRVAWRERGDDLRPYAETGARVAGRVARALFAVVRQVAGWAVLGLLIGGAFGYYQGLDTVWYALFGVMAGGGAGLFIGFIVAVRILFAQSSPDER